MNEFSLNAKLFFVIGAYAPQAYVRQYDGRNFADIDAGIDGIRWINACAESADKGSVWTKF